MRPAQTIFIAQNHFPTKGAGAKKVFSSRAALADPMRVLFFGRIQALTISDECSMIWVIAG